MRRGYVTVFVLFFMLCLAYSAGAETFTCLSCHSAMKGKIKTESGATVNVNVDSDRYAESVHGGFDCLMCHKQFSSNPHDKTRASNIPGNIATLAGQISHKAKVDPVAMAACLECHEEAYKAWQGSVHAKNILDAKLSDGAICTDCHGSPHYIMPRSSTASHVNRKNVVKTCGECHEKEQLAEKYKWGAHILERYRESFHGKKYAVGHPNAPTCVNCHNSHNIMKWDDPKSPVAWDNRPATCGKCHAGATKKFVAAITHKKMGKDDPIPYWFEKLLIVLLLSVFAFITGHVVLEAIAEIRDKVLRKGKEGHNE